MSYATVAGVAKLTGHKDGSGDAGGIIAQAITSADLLIKARIKAVGLTPPVSDDNLTAASELIAVALLRDRARSTGSLPTGAGGSFDTYDATNKFVQNHMKLGYEKVDEYIKSVSTNVQPYDTDGQDRADLLGDQFKLDQGDIGTFSD